MWSALFGLMGAGLGAVSSMSSANAAAQAQMYAASLADQQARRQQQMQLWNMMMGQDQMRAMQEENNYRRMLEQQNRSMMNQERQWQIGEYQKGTETLKGEREYMLARQIMADKEAAKQQQFVIEEYLKNKSLAADERKQALKALEEAKAVAKGERDEDMRRFYEERDQRISEREYAMRQYQSMQDRMVGERQYDIANRNKIEGRIDNLYQTLQRAQEGLGDMPTVRQFTEQDIAAEEARRRELGIKLVDRAADRVASINEANLIRSGIDSGDVARDKRGQITSQISDLYAQAALAARDDALKYIGGVQNTLYTGYDKELARRQAMLGEISGVEGTGIDALTRLKDPRSAVTNDFFNLPSAVYNRDIRSANNYSAPMTIGSSIINMPEIPYGMANTMNLPSAVPTGYANIQSAVMAPYTKEFLNPQNFFSAGAEIGNSLFNMYNTNAQTAAERAAAASMASGSALQNLFSSFGGYMDQMNFGQNSWANAPYNPLMVGTFYT